MNKVKTKNSKEEMTKELDKLRQRVAELEELNLRNNKLTKIISSIQDLIFALDKEGRFTDFYIPSDELYTLPDKFIGKKYTEVLPPHVNKLIDKALLKNKNGKVYEYEYSLEISGKEQWYHAKQSPLFSDGQFMGAVVVIRNISERKYIDDELIQYRDNLEKLIATHTKELKLEIRKHKRLNKAISESEERYHSLFENAPIGIYEIDCSKVKKYLDKLKEQGINNVSNYFIANPDKFEECSQLLNVLDINQTLVSYSGLKSKGEVLEFLKTNVWQKGKFNFPAKKFLQFIEENKTYAEYEYTSKIGDIRQYRNYKVCPLPGSEKTLKRVLVLVSDMTYLKSIEKKLKESYRAEKRHRRELEDEKKQRLAFTHMLVHELKTPLIPLEAASEFLQCNIKDKNSILYINSMSKSIKNLSDRVNELLDLAKGEMNQLTIKPRRFNIRELLEHILNEITPAIKKFNQSIEYRFSNLPTYIWADDKRLQQVLSNLFENASKFSRSGGNITFTAWSEKNTLYIDVKDNGIGIDSDQMELLFHPNRRLRISSDHRNGLGLGLSLSKMFVELHGGRLNISSSKGKGTTVSISIPIKKITGCKKT